MADTDRSFRKFMVDPKQAVMHYIAENLPSGTTQAPVGQHIMSTGMEQQEHSSQQYQKPNLAAVSNLSSNAVSNPNLLQPSLYQHPNQPEHIQVMGWQSHVPASMQNPMTDNIPEHPQSSNAIPHPLVPQTLRTDLPTSILAGLQNPISSVGKNDSSTFQPPIDNQRLPPQKGEQNANHMVPFGIEPPNVQNKRKTASQSASRIYHRMVLDYERAKKTFLKAQEENRSQLIAQSAYQLESLALQIWSLRREHATDFDGFTISEHSTVILNWHTAYDFWADIVLDIQEGFTQPAASINVGEFSQSEVQSSGTGTSSDDFIARPGGQSTDVPGSFPASSHRKPQPPTSLPVNMQPPAHQGLTSPGSQTQPINAGQSVQAASTNLPIRNGKPPPNQNGRSALRSNNTTGRNGGAPAALPQTRAPAPGSNIQ